jgi:hypothetical protein
MVSPESQAESDMVSPESCPRNPESQAESDMVSPESDPKGFAAGDTNLYRYVGNDPADSDDPSGMDDVYQLVREPDGGMWLLQNWYPPMVWPPLPGHGNYLPPEKPTETTVVNWKPPRYFDPKPEPVEFWLLKYTIGGFRFQLGPDNPLAPGAYKDVPNLKMEFDLPVVKPTPQP